MSITREEIAAFADGELDPVRQKEVAAAMEADPTLADQVRTHLALKARLSAHFAPIVQEPVPERLIAPLAGRRDTVVDLVPIREQRSHARMLPRWSWIAGPALAASLALAVFLPREAAGDYADGDLAKALDQQLAQTQVSDASTRILLSFRDQAGTYCRAFAGEKQSGIACRDSEGWRLRMRSEGVPESGAEYRMAGTTVAEVLERAQVLASGPALDAAQEKAAQSRGWR